MQALKGTEATINPFTAGAAGQRPGRGIPVCGMIFLASRYFALPQGYPHALPADEWP